jgi:hypothetical protein
MRVSYDDGDIDCEYPIWTCTSCTPTEPVEAEEDERDPVGEREAREVAKARRLNANASRDMMILCLLSATSLDTVAIARRVGTAPQTVFALARRTGIDMDERRERIAAIRSAEKAERDAEVAAAREAHQETLARYRDYSRDDGPGPSSVKLPDGYMEGTCRVCGESVQAVGREAFIWAMIFHASTLCPLPRRRRVAT